MNENRQVKDVAEYLKEVSETKAKWPNSILVFRGQENEEWLWESSAERRLKASLPSQEGITAPFLEYNENLIKKCRLKNYDKREQKQLDDLELLADLQHHGAATCLIDFTRNALIALWFACKRSEYEEKNGKVFIVNTAEEKIFGEIMHTNIKKSISDILQFKTCDSDQDQATELPTPKTFALLPNKRSFWHWTPAHLNERITAQHSLFLFGLPPSEKLRSKEIIIESASKEQIRKELETLHDICEESLFPDFVGFSYIQRADAPYLTLGAEEYFRSGIKAGQRGQYPEAIEDYTKAIERKSDYAEAYYFRGLTYHSKGEYDQAIKDFTEAIKRKSDYVEAFCFRGGTYYSKGEYDQAIKDFTEAIKRKSDYVEAFCFRGYAYSLQGKYDRGITDLTEAIKRKSDYAEAYYFRGLTYISQGKLDQAIKDFTEAIKLKPTLADAYYPRGLAWLYLQKWQEARSDLTAAKDMGFDIVASFRRYDKSVADFEQRTGIKLPEDIAAMLTKSEN